MILGQKKAIALGLLAVGMLLTGCKKQSGPETLETGASTPPPGPVVPPSGPEWVGTPESPTYTPPPPYAPPPPPPPPVTSAGPREHVVKAGETLWKIAGIYYDKSSQANVQKIVNANPGLNPDKIKIGQVILIPD